MMEQFRQTVRRAAQEAAAGLPQPRWALVQSFDPARSAVRVLVQPEGVLTGWLPIAAAGASAGWGVMAAPAIGDMAFVVPDGNSTDFVVVGFAHNDLRQPPSVPAGIGGAASPAQPGEVLLTHASGAVIRLAADGTIYMRGNVNIEGDLKVSGEIRDLNGVHGTVDDIRAGYNAHTHSDPQGGFTGTTSSPIA